MTARLSATASADTVATGPGAGGVVTAQALSARAAKTTIVITDSFVVLAAGMIASIGYESSKDDGHGEQSFVFAV